MESTAGQHMNLKSLLSQSQVTTPELPREQHLDDDEIDSGFVCALVDIIS
jgi:hypothetical protein